MTKYRRVNYYDICRLCTSIDEDMVHVFEEEGRSLEIESKLRISLLYDMKEDDPLPKLICRPCIKILECYHLFRETAIKSKLLLQEYVTSVQNFENEEIGTCYIKDTGSFQNVTSAVMLPLPKLNIFDGKPELQSPTRSTNSITKVVNHCTEYIADKIPSQQLKEKKLSYMLLNLVPIAPKPCPDYEHPVKPIPTAITNLCNNNKACVPIDKKGSSTLPATLVSDEVLNPLINNYKLPSESNSQICVPNDIPKAVTAPIKFTEIINPFTEYKPHSNKENIVTTGTKQIKDNLTEYASTIYMEMEKNALKTEPFVVTETYNQFTQYKPAIGTENMAFIPINGTTESNNYNTATLFTMGNNKSSNFNVDVTVANTTCDFSEHNAVIPMPADAENYQKMFISADVPFLDPFTEETNIFNGNGTMNLPTSMYNGNIISSTAPYNYKFNNTVTMKSTDSLPGIWSEYDSEATLSGDDTADEYIEFASTQCINSNTSYTTQYNNSQYF